MRYHDANALHGARVLLLSTAANYQWAEIVIETDPEVK
jgi:hypothetical protein